MDIQSDKSMFSARQHISNEKGVAYFVPDDYKKKNFDFSLEKNRLSDDELLVYGEMATDIRRHFEVN